MSRVTVIFVLMIAFVSCGSIRNIKVDGLTDLKIKTLKGNRAVIEAHLPVENRSSHNIYIKDADFEILRDGYSFGTAKLLESVVIKKHSDSTVVLLFNLEISDRMLILSGRIRAVLSGDDKTKLSLSGKIKAGTKIFTKNVKIINYELGSINQTDN